MDLASESESIANNDNVLDTSNATADSVASVKTREQRREERERLDAKVWADEIEAQRYEQYFVQLWDRIRNTSDKESVLSELPFRSLEFPSPIGAIPIEHGILQFRFGDTRTRFHEGEWTEFVSELKHRGYRLLECEWHHSRFERTAETNKSQVSFVLHIARPLAGELEAFSPQQRVLVRGMLDVQWKSERSNPIPESIVASNLELLVRTGVPVFQEMLMYKRKPNEYASAHPLIVYDLDNNGFPEIILSRWNRVYWNEKGERFREATLFEHFEPIAEAGLIADITGDGNIDFVTVNQAGNVITFAGSAGGKFLSAPRVVADVVAPDALAITGGDVDSDGDLDLWVTQYKASYTDGQMPTPYYDANDGEPSFLLQNQGDGSFLDNTESAGLSAKRNRRTYSSSLVDIDGDHDLDLLVVSDYAGVDLYENNGNGEFVDVAKSLLPARHLFGMAHTIADFDADGQTDFYAIGMSSTTARRLDRLQLGRDDRPDIHKMRPVMGYGNRMFLRRADRFVESPHAKDVARTGWSWGTSSFDFDLDGDRDIYVANGFRSGESCRDYCTTYWTHDIYTGSSRPNEELASFFSESMRELNALAISWNGYEHNSLLLNREENGFTNVAFLLGVGFEYDSRAVVGADLDRDGRPDLIVAEYEFVGRGFELSLHAYRNNVQTTHNWVGVDLTGGRCSPIGAKVVVDTDRGSQIGHYVTGDSFLAQHPATLHFGLGDAKLETIRVFWPDGTTEELQNPQLNRYQRTK